MIFGNSFVRSLLALAASSRVFLLLLNDDMLQDIKFEKKDPTIVFILYENAR